MIYIIIHPLSERLSRAHVCSVVSGYTGARILIPQKTKLLKLTASIPNLPCTFCTYHNEVFNRLYIHL